MNLKIFIVFLPYNMYVLCCNYNLQYIIIIITLIRSTTKSIYDIVLAIVVHFKFTLCII